MKTTHRFEIGVAATRVLFGMLGLAVLASTSFVPARATEIIPSFGMTKATDASAGDAKLYGGLALRAAMLPFLKLEAGIAYRQESISNGDVNLRMWPVTASLWLAPLPMVYAGGGLGWYRTTTDYKSTLPFKDTTTGQVGMHLGAGINFPIAPHAGLDLAGRYIFMQKNNDLQVPTSFNPDFWSTTLGLAIKF